MTDREHSQADPARAGGAPSSNDEVKRRADEASAKMTNSALAERVRSFHPNGLNSDDALKAMLDDYDRLVKEQEASTGQTKPVGTTG